MEQSIEFREIQGPSEVSGLRSWLRWFFSNARVYVSGSFIVVICLLAIAAPLVTGNDPNRIHADQRFLNPGENSLLGTDAFGRDIYARIVYGARLSLLISLGSVSLAVVAGILIGLLSGYFGSPFDMIFMRLVDAILAFPGILLAIFVVTFWGSALINIIVIIGILYIPRFARIVYSSTLSTKNSDYILAARAIGARSGRILWRGILPNVFAPVIVQVSLALGTAILLESSLSYLGLGPDIRIPSWGRSIQEAGRFITQHPWGVVFPSIAISATVLAFNILGDALRDRLDPRLRK